MRVRAFRTMARSALRVFTTGALVQLAMLCTLTNTADAAVTPIPFGGGGVGPITFDTLPALSNGWATASWGSSAGAITNAAQMDAAVNTNDVRYMVTPLGTDSTVTNATTTFGSFSTSPLFRWNSAGHLLESRPVGNAYTVLLGVFVNNTGSDIHWDHIGYDYVVDVLSGT